jgi:hypothetical protein
MKLLEPWLLLLVAAGVVASVLFARGAMVALRVLRHFDVARATEGQLALEHQFELASTYVRLAAVVQVGVLLLTVVAADRLSRAVRGAMCAYGVFQANEWGPRALVSNLVVAIAAGILARLYAFDSRVRGMDLVRPLAAVTVAIAPLAILDVAVTATFLGKLDLGVTASCCSVQLDSPAAGPVFASGPRVLAATVAALALVACVGLSALGSQVPRPRLVAFAGSMSLLSLPFVLAAIMLEVAPYVFESPGHLCPFCLLKSDALFIGYPLFGATLAAVILGGGAGAAGLLAIRRGAVLEAFTGFARRSLRRSAVAWVVVLTLGVAPVVRYELVSRGASLFR